ncbi:hypothetical protein SLH46_12845 [Draconibacterium sp. IB214405]|uniref:hypothetical protein n=1 Tax=Draconibacterium sp. IB214405 TaxID=3097352 RepID=UPI002A0CC3D6|nr:hypothetical protein [Draconibacterium sp. IB214405]MDX8340081.1 hypothetical protein [Draconibacterium sp. IB214405]
MKSKKLIVLFALVFVGLGYVQAQVDYQISSALDFYRQKELTNSDFNKQLEESDIKGSPYLNKSFEEASIFTTSKVQFKAVPLRYNIYNDRIEFETPEKTVSALAAPEIVEKIEFKEYTLVYAPYMSLSKMKRGFFQLLKSGNTSLYLKPVIQFEPPKEPGAYAEAKPAEFKRQSDDFYIRFGMEAAELIGNKKELVALFPDHQKEIEAFIKEKKIKTGKAEDLKELINYYSTL